MRKIYLIRHAEPERAQGPKRCISRTDAPLSAVGREQAAALHEWAAVHPAAEVYSSPAVRCRETALAVCAPEKLQILPELWEVGVGEWEGLTFEEIRRRWPQEYAARGAHLGTTAPPGGESFLQAGRRLERCLCGILEKTEGDLAIVAHGGLFRGWLCEKLGMDPDRVMTILQPWAGVTVMHFEPQTGRWQAQQIGVKPFRFPGALEQKSLLARCATPEPVQAHCRAVAAQAAALAKNAPHREAIDEAFLQAACLLHDLCRAAGRDHPAQAAALLQKEGYPELAEAIGQHHDLGAAPSAEAELLYLADKLVAGTQTVCLAQRFEAARSKCTTPQAQAAWERRYQDAMRLAQKYNVQ